MVSMITAANGVEVNIQRGKALSANIKKTQSAKPPHPRHPISVPRI